MLGFFGPYWKYIAVSAPLGAVILAIVSGDEMGFVTGFIMFPVLIITVLLLLKIFSTYRKDN